MDLFGAQTAAEAAPVVEEAVKEVCEPSMYEAMPRPRYLRSSATKAQETVVAAGAAMEDMADERFRHLRLEVGALVVVCLGRS